MKIYIIIIGEYEDQHIGFSSEDLDAVINFIYEHFNCKNDYEEFNIMECWEDNKQVFVYGEHMNDVVCSKSNITKEELLSDIMKYMNEEQNEI